MTSAARAQGGAGRRASHVRSGRREVLTVASRALVLQRVADHPYGVDAATLAQLTGLHANTVRFHLDHLTDAGLVAVSRDPARRPGRPRLLFTAVRVPPPAPAGTESGQEGYLLLAAALAKRLAMSAADPGHEAESAGRSWALDSATGTGPDRPRSEDQSVATLSALFAELGFAPEPVRDSDGWRILLHRCPFHSLAVAHPEIVCRLHLGMLQGAVDQLPHLGRAVRLQPFVEPELCEVFVPLATVSRRPTDSADG